MQESIYRMSGQVQAMQQEVRELAQLAQQLYQQHTNHFQQLQGQATQKTMMYQLAGNEQSSAQLLKHLTDVCTEMNSHLRTISQQMSSNASASQGQGQSANAMSQAGGGMQSSGVQSQKTKFTLASNQGIGSSSQGQQQQQAAAGPIVTDTTHINHAAVPGMDRRMTSQIAAPDNNQLNQATGNGMASFSDTSANAGMSASMKGAQNTSGMGGEAPIGQSGQGQGQSPMQTTSMSMGQGTQQQQGSQGQGQSSQMNYGTPMQSSMSMGQGTQPRRQSLGSQATGGTAMGGSSMGGSTMGSSTMGGQASQNKINAGASMSTQQSSTSASELQDNANEYREEPHYTKYPYNRSTT